MKMIMVKSKVFIDSIWSFIERFSVQGLQFLQDYYPLPIMV